MKFEIPVWRIRIKFLIYGLFTLFFLIGFFKRAFHV